MRGAKDVKRATATVRRAHSQDAAPLAAFATDTFIATYAEANTPANLARFLERTYGVAQQRAEIEDPAVVTLLAEVDGVLAGFVQLRHTPPPACVAPVAAQELGRFYVGDAWHGRGVAQTLMAEAVAEAARQGARVLWLGVFDVNERARRFYAKAGFVEIGEHHFYVGDDRQRDLVLLRVVDAA